METKLYAIIVAGGSGVRMGEGVKKQYLSLAGIPLMGHSLKLLDNVSDVAGLVLVAPKEDLVFVEREILSQLGLQKSLILVPGGKSRQESVYCGIQALDPEATFVLVHDAVRPFLTEGQVERAFEAAQIHGASSLAIPVTDTLRREINGKSEAISRENVFTMQTPQVFRRDLLERAHERALALGISGTDDAGLVADMEEAVFLVKGSKTNIKITEKDDLVLAEAICGKSRYHLGIKKKNS